MHRAVMLKEVLAWVQPRPDGVYLDATVGGGGHSEAILEITEPSGRVIGIDRDSLAVDAARERLMRFGGRVTLSHRHYSEAESLLRELGVSELHGVVVDLGVSSLQLETPARGFSFLHHGPLDMRMDRREPTTAADLVNRLPEKELARVIFDYGEERYARRIARRIVRRRQSGPILTTQALAEVIREAVPPPYLHGRLHYATRTFQALRIAVNRELESLAPSLRAFANLLAPEGRCVVLSFHSLEDRIVKQTFRDLAQDADAAFSVLTKKPLTPSADECTANPRARSAKLRVLARRSGIA